MVATHVDDLLYGYVPEVADLMNHILGQIILGKDVTETFRFCGREFYQDPITYEVKVTCEKTAMKMEPIRLLQKRIDTPDADATPSETTALRSTVGSQSWVVRSCRPEHVYEVSTLQQSMNKAKVSDVLEANNVTADIQAAAKRGLTFKPGLNWYESISICIGDSGFGNEDEFIDEWQEFEPFRSQGGKILAIGESQLADTQPGMLHILSFGSSIVRRVCRSTVQAEAYNLDLCVEENDLLRAALVDLRGLLDHKNWEVSAASKMHAVWFTDCKFLRDALCRTVLASIADKRLGITLAAMRQSLWRKPGGGLAIPRLMEKRPDDTTDSIVWIDTSVMPCDCLTKKMKTDNLRHILDTNQWHPRQTEEAKAQKANRQLQRQRSQVKLPPIKQNTMATGDCAEDAEDAAVEFLGTEALDHA